MLPEATKRGIIESRSNTIGLNRCHIRHPPYASVFLAKVWVWWIPFVVKTKTGGRGFPAWITTTPNIRNQDIQEVTIHTPNDLSPMLGTGVGAYRDTYQLWLPATTKRGLWAETAPHRDRWLVSGFDWYRLRSFAIRPNLLQGLGSLYNTTSTPAR